MSSSLDQIYSLLTTPPGNLTYHLVLTFSILIALVAGIPALRNREIAAGKRVSFGLALLLITRIFLTILAALSLSGWFNAQSVLPPVDRAVSAMGILLIIWLWSFSRASRPGDIAAVLLGMLVVTAGVLGLIIWMSEPPGPAFNEYWLSLGWEIFSALLLLLGLLLLSVRKGEYWGQGIAMLVILLLGHVLQIFLPNSGGYFPGAVRLAQIAAYPILFSISLRLNTRADLETVEKTGPLTKGLIEDVLTIASEKETEMVCLAFSRTITRSMPVDICFMVTAPDEEGEMSILCGYNMVRGEEIPKIFIPKSSFPRIAASMENNQPIHLHTDDTTKELYYLKSLLETETFGQLFAAPFTTNGKNVFGAIVATSPYTHQSFNDRSKDYLKNAANSLAEIVRSKESSRPSSQNEAHLQAEIKSIQLETDKILQENETLTTEVMSLREALNLATAEPNTLSSFDETHDWLQEKIAQLETENQQLRSALEEITPHAEMENELQERINALEVEKKETQEIIARLEAENEKFLSGTETSVSEEFDELINALHAENEKLRIELEAVKQIQEEAAGTKSSNLSDGYLEGELRNALKEIARLQKLLGEAEIQIFQLDRQVQAAKSADRWDMIVAIAQEMRQPMSSVIGYSDFLLSESVGILGTLQRKFLERVKTSTERMNEMVEDLVQIAAMEAGHTKLTLGIVDLAGVIDTAISNASPQIREKNITLLMDLPDNMPQLQGDTEAIQLILTHLIQNASSATPPEGEINISLGFESYGDDQDYILLQVTDSGGGIPSDEIQHVFKHSSDSEELVISGLGGSNVGLVISKTLVEAHGGRIWVETDYGTGSTFSILLPLTQTSSESTNSEWRS